MGGVLRELLDIIFSIGGGSFEEQETKTLPAGGYSHLDLRNSNGNIEVEGTEGEDVIIVATKKVRARSEEEGRRRLGQLKVVVSEERPELRVYTDVSELRPKGNWNVNYEVRIPKHMSLSAHTSNGNIKVSDLQGPVQVQTSNGNVEVRRLGGSVKARTSNGNIRLYEVREGIEAKTSNGNVYGELLTFGKEERTVLHSSNGNIELRVPEDTSAKVVAGTKNGIVRCELPISASLQRRNRLEGTIGLGEGEIELRTTNGNIKISAIGARQGRPK